MSKIFIILLLLISIPLNATNSLAKLKLQCDLGSKDACKRLQLLNSEQSKKSELTPKVSNNRPFNIDNKKNIIVTGYGANREQALNNAFKTAIEQYVGVIVDTDTMLKNGRLIKDNILTASNGFIQTYKELSVNEENGLFEVRIEAVVKSQKVFKKIKSLNMEILTVYNTEDAVARIKHEPVKNNTFTISHNDPINVSTMNKSKKNVENIMRKVVGDFFSSKSIKDMIAIEVTNMKIYENKANGETAPVKIYYTLSINEKIYNQKIEHLEAVFKNLGGRYHSKVDLPTYKQYHGDILWTKNREKAKNLKSNNLGILKKHNKGHKLDIWEFPSVWKDIYPFNIDSAIKLSNFLYMDLQFRDKENKIILSKRIIPESKKNHLPVSNILLSSILLGGTSYGFIVLKEKNIKIIAPMVGTTGMSNTPKIDCINKININIDDIEKIKYVTIRMEEK